MPGSSSRGIFLSYRREDSAPYARLLQHELQGRFPDVQVFMDLDSIEPGLPFAKVIRDAVGSCAVLVALIGRQWMTIADDEGRRRLDNPGDFVRFEVQTALERGVRVIPVLVDDARPPRQQQLPAGLEELAGLHALELSYGRYDYDADRLLGVIQRVLDAIGDREEAERRTREEKQAREEAEEQARLDTEKSRQQGLGPIGNRYILDRVIGRGGMAEVYRAKDHLLGRVVAVKILRGDLARDQTFQARFRREAQSAVSLNNASIVSVYDTGEDLSTGVPVFYIVMEYVDGRTVRDLLIEGHRLLPQRALEITSGVLRALEYSHQQGFVHRDIKPGNVMVTRDDDIKVMDFGIAQAMSDAQAMMAETAQVIGTAQYLSPEQARGERVDARSDLYSTGCLMYELLTGRPPFTGDSPVAIAYQHVRENPIPPSRLDPDIPPWADAIVLRAMAKSPNDRYQSAAEMQADIQRAASSTSSPSSGEGHPRLLGGRYELDGIIGSGGTAEVYRARDTSLRKRIVAIKMLHKDLAMHENLRAKFRHEAQSAARLSHPSIVTVYDTNEDSIDNVPLPYVVMEYVDGLNLHDLLQENRQLLPERALRIIDGVLQALDYGHQNGIVHRNIRPGNVMVTRQHAEIKVMDFGSHELSDHTLSSGVIGTADYLSPEQARGAPVDFRSDLYSTGCLLYELVSGRPPFTGDSPVAVAYQHVTENPLPPSQVNPGIPALVDTIVLKAMAKSPADRYQTAANMRTDIQRALASLSAP